MIGGPVTFDAYAERIRALPAGALSRTALLGPAFRLHREETFSVFYAPFDYVHRPARVALVGITPGWQQMEIAYRVARAGLHAGRSASEIGRVVKAQASFAGMRRRLGGWLDELGLADHLGLAHADELFGRGRELLHTTSAIRCPVIRANGENWNGSAPSPTGAPILLDHLNDLLAPELDEVQHALIVPLGSAVTKAMRDLVAGGRLDERRVLLGFPHPSGLNTRGPRVFAQNRDSLRRQVDAWFRRRTPAPQPQRRSSGWRGRAASRALLPSERP
jgi:hypothetical protein